MKDVKENMKDYKQKKQEPKKKITAATIDNIIKPAVEKVKSRTSRKSYKEGEISNHERGE